jgi:hypothetical protein
MGVSTLEVCYTSATTGRGDHEVHKGHVALERKKNVEVCFTKPLLLPEDGDVMPKHVGATIHNKLNE